MPNNIAVSITADVADLTAKRAIASAELKALQKDLNDLANTARTSGRTPELNTALLAAGDAAAKARSQVSLIDREMRGFAESTSAAHVGMSGVTRELIVLGREAGRGNFSRMAGSATILAQRLGVLTPTVLGAGAAIAAIAAPLAAFALAAEQGSEEVAKFQNGMEATNGYAGVTISQLQAMAKELASFAHEGVGAATKELMALAGSGQFTSKTLLLIGEDATRMSQLTGESADKWNAEFAKMSSGVAKFAAEYQQHYGQLTTAQAEYIQELEQQGRKEEAEYQLAKDIHEYLGTKAVQNLGTLQRAWQELGATISNAWDQLKAFGRDSNADKMEAAQSQIAYYQRAKAANPDSRSYDAPLAAARAALAAAQATEAVDEKRAKTQAENTERQKEGVAAAQKLHEQFEASRTSGEKLKATLQEIDANLAKAVAADPGNRALYEREAAAARSQAVKSDTPKTRAAGGESPMATMEDELRQSEFSIKSQTGDWQRDMQAFEASFWEGKLAEARKGSKLYGEILAKVQEAQLAQGQRAAEQSRQMSISDIDTKLSGQKSDLADRRAAIEAAYATDDAALKISANQKRDQLEILAWQEVQFEIDAQEAKKAVYGADAVAVHDAANQELQIRANLRAQLDEIERQHTVEIEEENRKREQSAEQTAKRQAEAWKSANNEMMQAEDRLVSGILGGRETMSQIALGIARDLVEKEIENDLHYLTEKMLLNLEGLAADQATARGGVLVHLLGEQQKTMATTTGVAARTSAEVGGVSMAKGVIGLFNEKAIMADAARAASGAYAAMAGIPLIGPELGAAAAATAFAGVMAFENMASFAVGTNVVPNDMIAQIHAGERIVPAGDNRRLIAAAEAGTGGGARGDNHFHYHGATFNGVGEDRRQTLEDLVAADGAAARRVFQRALRDRWFQ